MNFLHPLLVSLIFVATSYAGAVSSETIAKDIIKLNDKWESQHLAKEHWPISIQALKPFKVYRAGHSIVIATAYAEGIESGYYIYSYKSSFYPSLAIMFESECKEWSFSEHPSKDVYLYHRNCFVEQDAAPNR